MASFATPTELANYLQRDVDTASAQLALDLATGTIQAATGQTFLAVVGDVVTLEGRSGEIVLPQRPVTAVTAVSLSDYYGQVPYVAAPGSWRIVGARLVRLWAGNWPGLQQWSGGWPVQVRVTYDHGYPTIPADVKDVCLQLAAERFTNPNNYQMEAVDDYQYRRNGALEGVRQYEGLAGLVKRYGHGIVAVQVR